MDRAEFFANSGRRLENTETSLLSQILRRRVRREPLSYILGQREFYGLDFAVTPDVLIPRQETELLVEKALEFCSADRFREGVDIADVGTGSGAVAISIAHNLPQATLYATEISVDALAVADANRRRHRLQERIHLGLGDLLGPVPGPVDVIVSNPPYIKTSEIANLAPEVRLEPAGALDGGADGLDVIRRLLRQADGYLRPGGCMLVEIAPEQLEPVATLARHVLPAAHVFFSKDLLGLPRVVGIEPERRLVPGKNGQRASGGNMIEVTGRRT
jgi:release factor glutamine methyltransferase